MRVVFAGFGELGAAVLSPLISKHEVVAVLTHPAGFTDLSGCHVESVAREAGIPVHVSAAAKEDHLAVSLTELNADVLVSTNWRTRMPKDILNSVARGAINVHDALLPRYAGFGAVNWAIRDGADHTGLTVHFMDEQLDTGDIVLQTRVDIGATDDASTVYSALLAQYGPASLEALDLLAAGYRGTPQDHAQASFGHRIGLEDNRIEWTWDTTTVVNLIRAQSNPFLNAWCTSGNERLFIQSAAVPVRAARGTPGRVVAAAEGGVLVACGAPGGVDARGLVLLRVTPEGESAVAATEYFGAIRGSRYLR